MRRSLFALAIALTVGCGGERTPSTTSLVSPSPVVPVQVANFTGAWRVTYRNEECLGRHCYSAMGRESRVDIRLTQFGDRVAGIISGDTGFTDVSGTVLDDGRLSLTGSSTAGTPSSPGLVVDRLELALDRATTLTGYIRLLTRYDGDVSAYNGGSGGAIVVAQRAPLSTTFAGEWKGYYDTVSCSPGPYCLLESKGELALRLEQRGTTLDGVVLVRYTEAAAVGGSTDGEGATLSGTNGRVEVRAFNIRRDVVGRLSGRLTLTDPYSTTELALVRVGRITDEP